MKIDGVKEKLLEMGMSEISYFEGVNFDDAIIGYTEDGRIVYSYSLMVEYLKEKEGMSEEEALDWLEYNTIRTVPYMGKSSPIIVYDIF